MSRELAVAVVDRSVEKQHDIQWDDAALLATIQETVCKGATAAQFKMFVEVCKATGLNPWLKEIWYVPGVGVMAGRDAYLRRANENPMFDGMTTAVERDAQGIPIKATCTVWRKDRNHPIVCEAYYNEYKKSSQVWQTYKSAMISKVAEVLALKRSFAINGVVTEEEIGNEQERGSREAQKEVLDRKLKVIEAEKSQHTASPELINELNDFMDAPREEIAQAVTEAQQAGVPVLTKPEKRKRGKITFEALKHMGTIKKAIYEETGNFDLYYEVLKGHGYSHADEIADMEQGREIFKQMGVRLVEWRIVAESGKEETGYYGKELNALEAKLGSELFWRIAGSCGYDRDYFEQAPDEVRAKAAQEMMKAI